MSGDLPWGGLRASPGLQMLWTTSFPMGPDGMKFTRLRSVFIELHHVQRLDSWLATSVHPSPSSLLGTLPPLLFFISTSRGR